MTNVSGLPRPPRAPQCLHIVIIPNAAAAPPGTCQRWTLHLLFLIMFKSYAKHAIQRSTGDKYVALHKGVLVIVAFVEFDPKFKLGRKYSSLSKQQCEVLALPCQWTPLSVDRNALWCRIPNAPPSIHHWHLITHVPGRPARNTSAIVVSGKLTE